MNAPLFPAAAAESRTLRLYQETAIDLLRESLRTGHRRPILQLPTGAGKTRVAAEIINGALAKGRRAIFVMPRQVLIEQTIAAFEREGIWNTGVIQARNRRTNPNAPVQIAMAQTLARREIPPAGIVIIDECHNQYKSITKWISSPEWQAVPFIGLSATPWAKGLGKTYDDLLMPVSIQELIDEGYLSPFLVFAPPAPDLTDVRTVKGDFHEGDLSGACDKKELIADIIKTWLEKGENRPTLCYGVDRKHAQHLQERFAEAGVRVEYIDCKVEMYDREEIFERFRSGETNLICNVATLDTGLDLPNIGCIIDARPTKSRIRFVQTIGRGLRPSPGKDHLLVLDHAGNHHRLGLVTGIGCSELDNGEAGMAYDKDARVAVPTIKLCPECRCVLPPQARECPACGFKIYAATEVLERDGELVELGSRLSGSISDRHRQEWAKKDLWRGALVKIAKQKGYAKAHGWAAHKFREKFGHWPTLNYPPEREPTVEILNWVRSRQIAFARARARYG
jgi:DNA repair protein RadD